MRYATPLGQWRTNTFDQGDNAIMTEYSRDMLQAILLARSGPATLAGLKAMEGSLYPASDFLGALGEDALTIVAPRRKRIINAAIGARGTVELPGVLQGDAFHGPDIQHATRAAMRWLDANPTMPAAPDYRPSLGELARDLAANRNFAPDENEYQQAFYSALDAYRHLKKLETGTNTPLVRSVAGPRQFDFNLEGMAHYGLLPDMLQDVKNSGMTARQLAPLFRSAEDYIRMWEKCERLKAP